MSVTIETENAYRAYIDIQIKLRDAKGEAKKQVDVLQAAGENAARTAKNEAYNTNAHLSAGEQIKAAREAAKAAFAPYREQIEQVEANIAELQAQSDVTWKAYEVVRGIGA